MKPGIRTSVVMAIVAVCCIGGLTLHADAPDVNRPPRGAGMPPPRDGSGQGRSDGQGAPGRDQPDNARGDQPMAAPVVQNVPMRDSSEITGGSDAVAVSNTAATTFAPALAGSLTVNDASESAFTNPLAGFSPDQLEAFEAGDELFDMTFVAPTADPAITNDGLGPFFNATACGACHAEDGRGRAPVFTHEADSGFLVRTALNTRDASGLVTSDATYGGQLQDFAVDGLAPEGWVDITYSEIPGTFADGTPFSLRAPTYNFISLAYGDFGSGFTFSPRVANQMIGLGLLEAIPESTILSLADPDDLNADGISGRPNYVLNVATHTFDLGRFGWKANQPNLYQQAAAAFNGDMGVTSSLFPQEGCTAAQADCLTLAGDAAPEIDDTTVARVTLYTSSLSVPAQRNTDDLLVQAGEQIFINARCASCHISQPILTATNASIPQLSNQPIRPFTDLLLHDMGSGLADGQADYMATGSEWRTPPLWGIGLFETVNGHTNYLHDGRARNLLEAILWHGGEAQASTDAVIALSTAEREALVAFLKSL